MTRPSWAVAFCGVPEHLWPAPGGCATDDNNPHKRKGAVQRALAEDDHVIQALAADGSDEPFDVCPLPRRPRRRQHLFDAHRLHLLDEVLAEDPIAIPQQIARRGVPREGFAQSAAPSTPRSDAPLQRSGRMRRRSCASTRNTYRIWNRMVGTTKKSTDTMRLHMIVEERPPGLGRRLAMSHHVLGDGGLGDLDAEFQQLAVNARRAPERVIAAHHPDQIPNLLRHPGPTGLAAADFPPPEQAEALTMPSDNGVRLDDHQRGFPVGPHESQPYPEDSIG